MKRALKVTLGCLLITIALVLIAYMAGVQMSLIVALIWTAKNIKIVDLYSSSEKNKSNSLNSEQLFGLDESLFFQW